MAVINGAKSLEDVKRTIKAGFFSIIRVRILTRSVGNVNNNNSQITWVASPLMIVAAQKFVPVEVKSLLNTSNVH